MRRYGRTLSGTPVALGGAGDSVGRWGPLTTYGGRTEGEPCTGIGDTCGDYDVDAWLSEAKSWVQYAQQMRTTNIVPQWGTDSAKWPERARMGELAYRAARDLLGGDLGYLDSSKVATLIEVQRYAKLALEGYVLALEKLLNVKVEVSPELVDKLSDPKQRPPVIPLPKLPSFSSLIGIPVLLGGLVVVLVLAGGGRRAA